MKKDNRDQTTVKKKKGKKVRRVIRKIFTTILVLALLAGGAWYAFQQLNPAATISYNQYTATVGSINNALSFSGNLEMIDNETYATHASGTIKMVYVEEGQQVTKGTKLMRLSNGDTIETEIDGRVNKLYVAKDDKVSSGDSLAQVADFNHLKVSLRVDEYDISKVAAGAECIVTATSTEKNFTSSISSINYISESQGNVAYYTATVYVDLNGDEGVYPGMQVTVSVPQESAENVVVLKMDAITTTPQNTAYVLVKDAEGNYVQKDITVGVSNGNYVEIKSGLAAGDEVYAIDKSKNANASPFASMFGSTQMNPPSNRNWGTRPSGNFGNNPPNGTQGGGR